MNNLKEIMLDTAKDLGEEVREVMVVKDGVSYLDAERGLEELDVDFEFNDVSHVPNCCIYTDSFLLICEKIETSQYSESFIERLFGECKFDLKFNVFPRNIKDFDKILEMVEDE